MDKRRVVEEYVEVILSRSTENLRRGALLCFKTFLVSKAFVDKRGGGSFTFFRIFLSHSAEDFRRGTLPCFRKFAVLKSFKDKRGGGAYYVFPSNFDFFVSQYRQNSQGILPCFRKILVSENYLDKRRGWSITKFRRTFVFSTTDKKNVAQPFWVAKNFWYRTTSRIRGAGSAITTFRRNFFESE